MKIIITSLCLFSLSDITFGQDTIRLESKPHAIIKSWYPEFKDFPALKIGEGKILFTKIPAFKNKPISNNDVNLETSNSQVKVEEQPEKKNQYWVTVNPSIATTNVEFELWFEIGNNIILLKQNSRWVNAKEVYPVKGNRILIDTIKLEIVK